MDINIKRIIFPAIIALITAIILLVIRGITFRLLHRWAEKTETKMDDLVITTLKNPSMYWCIAIGLYTGITLSELQGKYVVYLSRAIYVIVIFSITIAAANLAGRIFRDYIQKSSMPIPATGLVYGLLKGTILVIGFLIILTMLGISVTPLITALGVGGLAVALALQDTLANLFAGIHILMEKSVRIGDFIRLETGQEGYVDDITWRTTRVRMIPNNMVIIPNNKLSQSVVTNYYLPGKRMSVQIPVRVSYMSDPDKIERIIYEVAANSVKDVKGLLSDPAPSVNLIPGFGEGSLDFTLTCHVEEVGDQNPVQHELRKRILKRFREEGIDIPLPHRIIHIREEKDKIG